MNTLHSSVYAVAFASCVLLLFVAGGAWRRHLRGSPYLIALIGLQALNFAFEWLMLNPSTPAKALWLALVMALAFLFAPTLWSYARCIDEPAPPRLRDLPRAHRVPIFFGLLLLLPLVASTHLGTDFPDPSRPSGEAHTMPIHGTMLAVIALFALQAFYYLHASVRILKRHARVARALSSNLDDRELDSLRLLIVVVGAHWIMGIVRGLHPLLLGKDAGYVVLFAICEVMFTVWATVGLLRGALTLDPPDRQLGNEIGTVKYERSALDAPARARILRKLGEAWRADGLHRDGRLTLRRLCERLRENPHYVSQVINQDLGTSFYDLVNRQRIEDAMAALTRQPDRPVFEIALEVGFNSKSTFHAAFREHARTTPSAFRRGQSQSTAITESDPAG